MLRFHRKYPIGPIDGYRPSARTICFWRGKTGGWFAQADYRGRVGYGPIGSGTTGTQAYASLEANPRFKDPASPRPLIRFGPVRIWPLDR